MFIYLLLYLIHILFSKEIREKIAQCDVQMAMMQSYTEYV